MFWQLFPHTAAQYMLCSLLSLPLIIRGFSLGWRGFYWVWGGFIWFEGVLLGLFSHFRSWEPPKSWVSLHVECKAQPKLPPQLWDLSVTHFPLHWECHMSPNRAVPSHLCSVNTGRLAASLQIYLRGKYLKSRIIFFSAIFWIRFCLCVAKQAFYTQFMDLHWLVLIILWVCMKLETFL